MIDVVAGRVFGGRWKIERALMTGGMGSVFVASHTETGRKVALKVVKTDAAQNPEFVARFKRETGALAAVSHPNVVGFLDSGVEEGTFFLVMELLEGVPLRTALAGAPFEWRRAFRIAADVCRALAAVHQAGIVHRDLKPENIFLQRAAGIDEIAKLIDFGIVRLQEGLSNASPTAATTTGAVVGTPGYISPEQLKGENASPASDVYAVGVIAYEMVTGKFPFAAPTPHAMLVKQLMEPLSPPRAQLATVPAHVENVIVKLLSREPQERPASALAALSLLQDALKADDSLAPTAPTEDGVATGQAASAVLSSARAVPSSSTNASPIAMPTPATSTNAAAALAPAAVAETKAPMAWGDAREMRREERRRARAQRSFGERVLRTIGIVAVCSMIGVVGTCGMCARACGNHDEERRAERAVKNEIKESVEDEIKKDLDVQVKPKADGKGDVDIKLGPASLHLTDVDMPDAGATPPNPRAPATPPPGDGKGEAKLIKEAAKEQKLEAKEEKLEGQEPKEPHKGRHRSPAK